MSTTRPRVIVLSDDEVVAVAAASAGATRAPLPSLETDEQSLGQAAKRGLRSLRIRLQHEPDLALEGLVDLLQPALGEGGGRLATFVAPPTALGAPLGDIGVFFPGDGDAVLADGVNAEGIHAFTQTTLADCLASLRDNARRFYAQASAGDDGVDSRFVAVARSTTAAMRLVVGPRVLSLHALDEAGQTVEESSVTSIDDALAVLSETARLGRSSS